MEQGTLAPVELTRAQAQVAAATQDLANARGFERQQELIVKTVETRRGMATQAIRDAPIVLTTAIEVPEHEPVRPVEDPLAAAFQNRPELQEASLQIRNSNIALSGSRNELLPELDLVATAQNTGMAGHPIGQTAAGSNVAPSGSNGERWRCIVPGVQRARPILHGWPAADPPFAQSHRTGRCGPR